MSIHQALDDVKMGTAALEDALIAIDDALPDSNLADRDVAALEANRNALDIIISRANAVIGSMVRVIDRATSHHSNDGISNGR